MRSNPLSRLVLVHNNLVGGPTKPPSFMQLLGQVMHRLRQRGGSHVFRDKP